MNSSLETSSSSTSRCTRPCSTCSRAGPPLEACRDTRFPRQVPPSRYPMTERPRSHRLAPLMATLLMVLLWVPGSIDGSPFRHLARAADAAHDAASNDSAPSSSGTSSPKTGAVPARSGISRGSSSAAPKTGSAPARLLLPDPSAPANLELDPLSSSPPEG